MDANVIKSILGGAVAIAAMAYSATLFSDWGEGYQKEMAPRKIEIPKETPADCVARTDKQAAYLKKSMRQLEDKELALRRGDVDTKNEAHEEYLEDYYDKQRDQLEERLYLLRRETCDGGG